MLIFLSWEEIYLCIQAAIIFGSLGILTGISAALLWGRKFKDK
jgi:hypothetical protein